MTNEFDTAAADSVSNVVHETVSTPVYTTTGTTYASTPTYVTTTPTYTSTSAYTTTPTYATTPTYTTVPLTEYPAAHPVDSYTYHTADTTHYQPYTNYDTSHHHYHHTDGLALGALIAAIAGLTILPVFGSIVAIILGIIALHRIRATGENGHGMALAGIVLGIIGLLLGIFLAGWLATLLGTGYWGGSNVVRTTYPY